LNIIKSDFLKNAGKLFSGSLIAQAISFGALYFLAKLYSPSQFGSLEIFVKLAGIGTVISGLRYELAIVAVDEEDEAQDITRLSLWLNFIISIVLFLFLSVFKDSIATLFNIEQPNILFFVPLATWLMGSTETLIFLGNRQRNYKTISNNRILSSVSGTAYKLLHPFIRIVGNGLIIGQVLSQIIAFAHLLITYPIQIFLLR
jgi:O-antigen/teichoic acid export membrane protein